MRETRCAGCDTPLGVFDIGYSVCMDCTKARAKVATGRGGCKCPKSKKRPTEVLGRPRQRQWIACNRCLGTITQVN